MHISVSIFSLCVNVCKYIPTFITRLISVGKKSPEVEEKSDLLFHATSIDLFTSTLGTECGKKHAAVIKDCSAVYLPRWCSPDGGGPSSAPRARSHGWRGSLKGDQPILSLNEESHIQCPWRRVAGYLSTCSCRADLLVFPTHTIEVWVWPLWPRSANSNFPFHMSWKQVS